MANVSRNPGFKPYGSVKKVMAAEAGSTVYPGDAIALASDGQIDAVAAAGDIYGVALNYATVGNKVLISCDPEQIYIGQADGVGIAAQTSVGQTMDVVVGTASTTFKASRQQLDASSVGASQQFLLLGLAEAPDNAFGTSVKFLCKINQHQAFGTDDFAGI